MSRLNYVETGKACTACMKNTPHVLFFSFSFFLFLPFPYFLPSLFPPSCSELVTASDRLVHVLFLSPYSSLPRHDIYVATSINNTISRLHQEYSFYIILCMSRHQFILAIALQTQRNRHADV